MHIEVDAGSAGMRLDLFLTARTGATRSQVAKWLEGGAVTPACRPSYRVAAGEVFAVEPPEAVPLDLVPEDVSLDIRYEDGDLLVVNKPAGMVVHPSAGHDTGTLVHALLAHCGDLSGINGEKRPGIVHRLDRDTTGGLLIAKNDRAHLALSEQLAAGEIVRGYYALVFGQVKEEALTLRTFYGRHPRDRKRMAVFPGGGVGRREAVTHVRVREHLRGCTLVQCLLGTGRTHQIRVHMAHIGHPVLGDPVYGPVKQRPTAKGQLLHAGLLSFEHPATGERMRMEVAPPEHFMDALRKAGWSGGELVWQET